MIWLEILGLAAFALYELLKLLAGAKSVADLPPGARRKLGGVMAQCQEVVSAGFSLGVDPEAWTGTPPPGPGFEASWTEPGSNPTDVAGMRAQIAADCTALLRIPFLSNDRIKRIEGQAAYWNAAPEAQVQRLIDSTPK